MIELRQLQINKIPTQKKWLSCRVEFVFAVNKPVMA
jgi:hypothetical protein